MEVVGGYSELMKLPLAALQEVFKYLDFVNKQASKGMPKVKR